MVALPLGNLVKFALSLKSRIDSDVPDRVGVCIADTMADTADIQKSDTADIQKSGCSAAARRRGLIGKGLRGLGGRKSFRR